MTTTDSIRWKRVTITIIIATSLVCVHSVARQNDTITTREGNWNWGISAGLGGEGGGVNLNIVRRISGKTMLVVGYGFFSFEWSSTFSSFPLKATERDERSIFACERFYFSKTMYAMTGILARAVSASFRTSGQRVSTTLGAVGFPIAVGVELRARNSSLAEYAELGFAQLFGPGANDFPLTLTDNNGNTTIATFAGGSGILLGFGFALYF